MLATLLIPCKISLLLLSSHVLLALRFIFLCMCCWELTSWLAHRSIVYAADLFATGFAADPMDPQAGRRYRQLVLERGSSLSEAEILSDFLHRKPNSRAIFDHLKLSHT